MREVLDDYLEDRNPQLRPSWACPPGMGTEQPPKGRIAASFQSAAPASNLCFEEMFHWASQRRLLPELHFIFTTCCTGTVVIKEGRSVRRSQGGLTRVCPEVSCEGVPPPAGVATEGTFERFLPRVQLDVPQQVPLLGKRSSTLVTVEGAFTWKGRGR